MYDLKIILICFLSHGKIIPAHQPESAHVTTATTLTLELLSAAILNIGNLIAKVKVDCFFNAGAFFV